MIEAMRIYRRFGGACDPICAQIERSVNDFYSEGRLKAFHGPPSRLNVRLGHLSSQIVVNAEMQ